eukprot:3603383-Lingulodinium_polyedra.AAC.1
MLGGGGAFCGQDTLGQIHVPQEELRPPGQPPLGGRPQARQAEWPAAVAHRPRAPGPPQEPRPRVARGPTVNAVDVALPGEAAQRAEHGVVQQ